MENILISFLYLLLQIAIICFIGYVILWAIGWFGISIDGNVLKFGKIIFALLILIAVVMWLFGVVDHGGGLALRSPFGR